MGIQMEEVVVLLVILVIVAVFLAVYVAFLTTLYRSLKLAGEHSRMSPGHVFLNLIPLFNLGWIFYTVIKVAEAVKGKCMECGQDPGDGGYGIGIAYAACMAGSILPCIGMLAGVASLVLWIVYWIKIADYNKRMQAGSLNGPADYESPQ